MNKNIHGEYGAGVDGNATPAVAPGASINGFAKAIHIAKYAALLVVAWQLGLFLTGATANPVTPLSSAILNALIGAVEPPSAEVAAAMSKRPLYVFVEGIRQFSSWVLGIMFWAGVAMLVTKAGNVAARVAMIGWSTYREERREAGIAAQIEAGREAIKVRRRRLRRKALEAQNPSRGMPGFLLFMLGLLVGTFIL